MSVNNESSNKPEFSARSADPNVMTSTTLSVVRKHWYVGIKTVALYIIYAVLTSSISVHYWFQWVFFIPHVILWVYFDYMDIYKLAMRDYNLVKYNYLEYDPLRGLKTGLLAQLPGLVCVIMMCVLSIGSGTWSGLFQMLWMVFYSPFVVAVGAAQSVVGSSSMWVNAPFYLIPMVFQPLIGYLAYKNGYNNIGILYKLIYKSRDKDKRLR